MTTQPTSETPATRDYDVFLSHSGKDTDAVRVVAEALKEAGLEPFLDVWHLVPGEPWQEALERALVESRTCAVFLGPTGLGPWENEEMRFALSQRVRNSEFRVIPVLLPGADYPSAGRLPPFLARHTWVDFRPGLDDVDAFHRLVSGIRGVAPETGATDAAPSVNPFRGLEVFDEDHAEFFFGREALTQRLVEELREDRFLAVIGPSGSGKSSVVRAGLIPLVRAGALPDSGAWPIAVLRPGTHPMESLASALVPVLELPGGPLAARDEIIELVGRDERGLHNAVATVLAGAPVDRRVLIFIDQFEEIFSPECDRSERDRFVAGLLYASTIAGGRAVVVLTMRADYFGKVAAMPALAARIADRDVLVPPLSTDELRDAIVKPAERVGLELEKGLVDTILDDLGSEPGALPLLQLTLLELWEGRRGRWLTVDRYHAIGGVKGAIAQRAEAAFGRLTDSQQQAARRLLLRLTSPGEGTEDSRRRVTIAELMPSGPAAEDVQAVIDQLTSARLLTTNEEPGGEVVDVAHEALIRGWPRLQDWLNEDPTAFRIHRRLTETANAWAAGGQDASDLYRGTRLDEAVAWTTRDPGDLSASEQAFLDASVALRDEETRARAAEVRARQRLRRLLMAVGGAGVLAVALAAAVAFVNWQRAEDARGVAEDSLAEAEVARGDAERSATIAAARLALSEARRVADAEPLLGLRLASEGLEIAAASEIEVGPFREELIRQIRAGRIAQLGTETTTFDIVGNGNLVVVSRGDEEPGRLFRVADGTLVDELPAVQLDQPTYSFPEGSDEDSGPFFVVPLGQGKGLQLRRVSDGSAVQLPAIADDIQFTRDHIVVRYPAGPPSEDEEEYAGPWTAQIRSNVDGALIAAIERPFTRWTTAEGADWATALVERDAKLELLDLKTGDPLGSWEQDVVSHRMTRGVIPISAPGHCVIARARDGVELLDLPGSCRLFAVSADRSTIAARGNEGDVAIVRLAGGDPVSSIPGRVSVFKFSPAEAAPRIAIALVDGSVRLFDTASGDTVADLGRVVVAPGSDPADRIEFSADGTRLVVRSEQGAQVYETGTGARVQLSSQFGSPEEQPRTLAFSRSSSYMVAYYGDRYELLRWDGTAVSLASRAESINLWPGGGNGPTLVSYRDGTAEVVSGTTGEGRDALPVSGMNGWAYRPADRVAAIVTDEAEDLDRRSPVVVVDVDGDWESIPIWSFTTFSSDANASAIVLERSNGASELWDRSTPAQHLANLGLGVTYVEFTPDATALAVRYVTGELDLISVTGLRANPPALESRGERELIDLGCSRSAVSAIPASRIESIVGRPAVACR